MCYGYTFVHRAQLLPLKFSEVTANLDDLVLRPVVHLGVLFPYIVEDIER